MRSVVNCLKAVALVISVMLVFNMFEAASLQDDPTVQLTVIPSPMSLFQGDTCIPPCWFGFISGETTSIDIVENIEEMGEIFDLDEFSVRGTFDGDTPYLIEGRYSLEWQRQTVTSNSLVIRDGVLGSIRAYINTDVTLGQTLEVMGEPDYINVVWTRYSVMMNLSYMDVGVSVLVRADRETCSMSSLLNDYQVGEVSYYSPDVVAEVFEEHGALSSLIPVPEEEWRVWLTGEVDGSCIDTLLRLRDIPTETAPPP